MVWSFSDIQISTTPSKFLLYYYIGLFDLPNNLPGWLARTPVALFALVGAASTYTFTRMLFSRAAALTAVIILAVFPFMIFHERMSLTDPLTASIVMLALWYSLVLSAASLQTRWSDFGPHAQFHDCRQNIIRALVSHARCSDGSIR